MQHKVPCAKLNFLPAQQTVLLLWTALCMISFHHRMHSVLSINSQEGKAQFMLLHKHEHAVVFRTTIHQQAAGVGCRWQSRGTCNRDKSVWMSQTGYFNYPWREKAAWWHSAVHLMEVPRYPKSASFSALVCKNVWKISSGIDSHIADLCDQEGRIWLPVSPLCHSKFGEASLGTFLQLTHLWVCFKMLHAYRLKFAVSFQS